MEAAIRFSPTSTRQSRRFLLADVAGNSIQHCEISSVSRQKAEYKSLAQLDKLPNFTAFDWHRSDESTVAIGTWVGETKVFRLDPSTPQAQALASADLHSFPVKLQRRCNSIAFSQKGLLAVGLDRIRGDTSLNVYDLNSVSPGTEPVRRLAGAEVMTNVKFFSTQPDLLLAGSGGIARAGQNLKLYDLREPSTAVAAAFKTRHVHLLSIDPFDENYFASAGPAGENTVSIWDRRVITRQSAANLQSTEDVQAVLEIRPAISTSVQANLGSLRISAYRRGEFALLSTLGQMRVFHTLRTQWNPLEQLRESFSTEDDEIPPENLYVKRVQELWAPRRANQAEMTPGVPQPIAFDFADPACFNTPSPMITLLNDRTLKVLNSSAAAPLAELSATSNLAAFGPNFSAVSQASGKDVVLDHMTAQDSRRASATTTTDETVQAEDFGPPVPTLRNTQRDGGHQHAKADVSSILTTVDLQRRRCVEGYLLDCDKNQKVLRNDTTLVEMWGLIKRMKQMAQNHGLTHKGIDFAYLGVHDVWFANIGKNPVRHQRRTPASRKDCSNIMGTLLASQGYGKFQGVKTEFPGLRQLGLALCGWRFDEKQLRDRCVELISRRQYYKAVVLAVCHGNRVVAIELLRTLTRTKAIENSALAAVIACETVTDEQRDLCGWMAEDTEEPHLKSLLTYWVHGSWEPVIAMEELACIYRVSLALKYMTDAKLTKFLEETTAEVVRNGNLDGVILTGLGETSMDLFQTYLERTNDLQTAVSATAFSNPRYVQDTRWDGWKTTYFDHMQAWHAFVERSLFITQHTRLSSARVDAPKAPPKTDNSVTFRCNSCRKPITNIPDPYDSSDDEAAAAAADAPSAGSNPKSRAVQPILGSGVFCDRCGVRFGRCCICRQWQGAVPDGCGSGSVPRVGALDERDLGRAESFTQFIGFCFKCRHGYHLLHAREWFARHEVCAVPGCRCLCGLGGT